MAYALIHAITRYIDLTKEEKDFFSSLLILRPLRQGEFIEKSGEPTRNFINVNTGCVMTYFTDKDGQDHVIQFATAGWWTGDLHSFTKQIPSVYSTRALADSEVLLLPRASMDVLLNTNPKFEKYFRIIFQNSLVTHQHRIIQNFSASAEERYQTFKEKYPPLEQFVPQKYIASYLGITPEFLSKIRRKSLEK